MVRRQWVQGMNDISEMKVVDMAIRLSAMGLNYHARELRNSIALGNIDPNGVMKDHALSFYYFNYQGKYSQRLALPLRVAFSCTPYHKKPQWLLEAWDIEKDALRTFAMADMFHVEQANSDVEWFAQENIKLYNFYEERDATQAARIQQLEKELETERMRLAACGVVALANTVDSAATAREMHPDYMSASCQDVINAVDREMALREEVGRLTKQIEEGLPRLMQQCHDLREEVERLKEELEENNSDAAVAAIKYALEHWTDEPVTFLKCWMDGDFSSIREEWDEVPDEVFIGADPLFKRTVKPEVKS